MKEITRKQFMGGMAATVAHSWRGAFAAPARMQRNYLDMTWWDPYVEDITDVDTYLRSKFRQDVTDRTTGVGVEALKKILAEIVAADEGGSSVPAAGGGSTPIDPPSRGGTTTGGSEGEDDDDWRRREREEKIRRVREQYVFTLGQKPVTREEIEGKKRYMVDRARETAIWNREIDFILLQPRCRRNVQRPKTFTLTRNGGVW